MGWNTGPGRSDLSGGVGDQQTVISRKCTQGDFRKGKAGRLRAENGRPGGAAIFRGCAPGRIFPAAQKGKPPFPQSGKRGRSGVRRGKRIWILSAWRRSSRRAEAVPGGSVRLPPQPDDGLCGSPAPRAGRTPGEAALPPGWFMPLPAGRRAEWSGTCCPGRRPGW